MKITITHLVLKAAALMIQKYPDINGITRWGKIYLRKSVDIFAQVAIEEPSIAGNQKPDLSGAKLKNCDQKSLVEIAQGLRQKSGFIREGEYRTFKSTLGLLEKVPDIFLPLLLRAIEFFNYDLGWDISRWGIPYDPFGSAMVTSVGSLKSPSGYAPLVPLSRCPFILCVGCVTEKPWVVDHQVVVRPVIDFRGTFDHRFMDGVTAARMFHYFNEIMANPDKYIQ